MSSKDRNFTLNNYRFYDESIMIGNIFVLKNTEKYVVNIN